MAKLNEFYAFLTSRGYQPLFVLTKADRLPDEVLIGHNENLLDSGIVHATIDVFCELSKIPRASVMPVINYTGPYTQGPDYVIETLVLNAVKAALRQAETFLELHEEEILEDAREARRNRKKEAKKKGAQKSDESDDESNGESDESDHEAISDEDSDSPKSSKKVASSPKPSAKPVVPHSPSSASLPLPLSPCPSIFSLIEAAQYLKIEESEMLELLESKEVRGKKIGSKWRVTKDSIDKYLNEN
jgi:excisionase family DNA binding protein